MSTAQKWLKILSLLAVVGGVDLAITAAVLLFQGGIADSLIVVAIMIVAAIVQVVLGVLGVGAANTPRKISSMTPAVLMSLLLTIVGAVLAVMANLGAVSAVINALIAVGVVVMYRKVNREVNGL